MAEALAEVRSKLGPDAVVLHTRTFKRGGVLGVGAKTVVEVTAADGREIGRQRGRASKQSPRAQKLTEARQRRRTQPAAAGASATQEPLAGDLIKKTYFAARAELEAERGNGGGGAAVTDSVVNVQPIGGDTAQLADELKAVRRLVERVARSQSRAAAPGAAESQDALFAQYLSLIEQEVGEELAEEIIADVRRGGSVAADDDAACREAIRGAIRDRIARMLPAEEPSDALPPTPDGRPRVIALVGPTGVGKTTTVAKLAATLKLKQNKQVALVTMDTYRIAAVDQLRTYAGILGLPLEVVNDPDQMRQAIARHSDKDAVLIDTVGRSQRDEGKLAELAAMIAAAQPHETHLVLSSTATQRVLMEIVERFAKIETDHIIFTKLDEAVTFGTLLNVACTVKKRLSYLTTGQEVPHQIEPGRPDRLARLVLGETGVA